MDHITGMMSSWPKKAGYASIPHDEMDIELQGESGEIITEEQSSFKSSTVRNVSIIGSIVLLASLGLMVAMGNSSDPVDVLGHGKSLYASCHKKCDDPCAVWEVRICCL
jgi:hypothetical protein